MTVGYYSPMPPARTGVADYSASLLPALRGLGAIEANPSDADVCVYHAGNNQLHRPIYERALRRSGIVVLHDAVLHHFHLGAFARDAYIEEFVYNYGGWTRGLATELWENRARSAQDPRYFSYPMVKRLAEASRAVIVHNPAAAAIVRAHAPGTQVFEIPFPYRPPALPDGAVALRLRAALGLRPRTCVFGVFGYLRESKRLMTVFRAFTRLRAAGCDAALLVAGEFCSADLERATGPLLRRPGVLRFGYTPERRFWELGAITDVCINLRYPAAGESSAIGIPFMGVGKTVVMTAGEEVSRFPETACLRVDAGPGEQEMLFAFMLWLSENPDAAREIGWRAAEYIASRHTLDRVARLYWDAIASAAGGGRI